MVSRKKRSQIVHGRNDPDGNVTRSRGSARHPASVSNADAPNPADVEKGNMKRMSLER
jgi:hypothetical protein